MTIAPANIQPTVDRASPDVPAGGGEMTNGRSGTSARGELYDVAGRLLRAQPATLLDELLEANGGR